MSNFIGQRIVLNIDRPDKELIEKFRGLPASNIGDMMGRLYCTDATIHPMNKSLLCGTAFTVKCPMGDNMMFHRALDLAQPGDILVIDGQGGMERALAGEMMVRYAIAEGISGFVVNGCMRDDDAIHELTDFPVYCKGLSPQGPYKFGPGEINVPVCVGGQVVLPGDILVGDADGIVVIRKEDAPVIAQLAREKFDGEQATLEGYSKGVFDHSSHKKTYNDLTLDGKYQYIF